MWALYIALFGGVFWLCKLGHDRLQSKETDRRIAMLQAQYERWENSVRDDFLNKWTIDMVHKESGYLKLQEEALDVIHKLPGMEFAKLQGARSSAARHAVRFIVMVKRGKLPHGDCDRIPLSIWQCTDISFSKKAIAEFARWAESTMQANGHPEARLYYSEKLSGAVNNYEKSAIFLWEPAITSFEGVYSASYQGIERVIIGESSK